MRTGHKLIGFGIGLLIIATAGIASRSIYTPNDPEEREQVLVTPNASSGSCGVERWSVKTGTDADVGLVNLNSTSATTIAALRALTAPATPPANNRVQPTETTEWVLSATLQEYKLESDSDYHLVIADAAGNTMIAEIPDPACVGTGSPFTGGIQVARQEFDNKYVVTTSFKTANIPVCLKGVGFFDFQHGQTGVAPNAIELHPVLDVQFNPTSCSAGGGGGNSTPVATNGSVSTTAGTPVNGMLAASDTDGDSLTFAVVANPAHGAVSITDAATGAFSYTPASGFSGSDSFTFHATDSAGKVSNTATESITVSSSGGGGTTALSNGVPATGLSGAVGAQLQYSLAVPSGATGLKFVTSGGTGDADLYVRFGSAPTTGSYDCRSINSGTNAETCNIAAAQAGTYYVMVYGYAAFSGLSLTGSYTAGGGGGGSQLIGDPGFEGGSANTAPWTISTGVVSNSSSEPPHTGTWDAWMDGYGSAHTDTASQQVAIPSTVTSATLSFWLHIDTAETGSTAYDKLTAALYNTGGTLLKTLGTYSNADAASGYVQHSFDVSAYRGQTVVLKFTGTEDASLQTSFVLDDVNLNTQ